MLNTIIKTIILYFSMMSIMRLMGKRQLGELQPFDLVIAIIIAEVAATPLDQAGTPLSYGLAPIITLLFFHNVIAFISLKSSKVREFVSGKPNIVISKGIIDIHMLKSIDYSLNDLVELLRSKDIFDLSEIDYAIIETNGSISVLKNPQNQTVEVCDLELKSTKNGLIYILISDGKLDDENINLLNINKHKLVYILKKTDHLSISDIFCFYVNDVGDVYIQTYKKKVYKFNGALKPEVKLKN